jgi:RNA polymerase-binding transcription factor DksA
MAVVDDGSFGFEYCFVVDLVSAGVAHCRGNRDQVFVFSRVNLELKVQKEIRRLQNELEKTREQIAKLEASLQEKPNYGLGQGDPAIVRWQLDQAILEQSKERAVSLEQAITKLQQGTYGTCEQCDQPIHPDRLAVLPETKLCIDCARRKN